MGQTEMGQVRPGRAWFSQNGNGHSGPGTTVMKKWAHADLSMLPLGLLSHKLHYNIPNYIYLLSTAKRSCIIIIKFKRGTAHLFARQAPMVSEIWLLGACPRLKPFLYDCDRNCWLAWHLTEALTIAVRVLSWSCSAPHNFELKHC